MALVADVGRWRGRHLPDFGENGLTPAEAATIVRTVLPLATLAPHAGKGLGIRVDGTEEAEAWARVDEEGNVYPGEERGAGCRRGGRRGRNLARRPARRREPACGRRRRYPGRDCLEQRLREALDS